MLDYSRKFKTECSKAKLDPQVRAMAELMVQGWTPQDAFIAVGFYKPALSDEYNKSQIEKYITDSDFNVYMEARRKAIKRGILKTSVSQEEDEEQINIPLLDKESVLKEMIKSAMSLPVNDVNRINILQKYSELQQMKKDEVKEEETLIHYYLPLTLQQLQPLHGSQSEEEIEKGSISLPLILCSLSNSLPSSSYISASVRADSKSQHPPLRNLRP